MLHVVGPCTRLLRLLPGQPNTIQKDTAFGVAGVLLAFENHCNSLITFRRSLVEVFSFCLKCLDQTCHFISIFTGIVGSTVRSKRLAIVFVVCGGLEFCDTRQHYILPQYIPVIAAFNNTPNRDCLTRSRQSLTATTTWLVLN